MSVIDQLATVRRTKHISALAVGRSVATHPSNIYAIEKGRRDARLTTAESIASALGARLLVVDTEGRASAAESAEVIRAEQPRARAAIQALTQLVADLKAVGTLGKAALTAEAPAHVTPEWDAAIAGVVEFELARGGLPAPPWARDVVGDADRRWDPWTDGRLLPDPDDVPEPLRRRGVWIGAGELESA